MTEISNPDCLFCKIAAGTIPVKRLHEDEVVLAFPDISPQAPVHVLLIPKQHLTSHAHATAGDTAMLGHLLAAAGEVAQAQGLGKGYRLVINTGSDGGQTVEHLHVHLLGGRHLGWPPG
ncbi:MAG TPA: histidine triad nucleotide-binding protein [Granulicella sp.]|jgi:histidine triad (HIT) family protein